MRAFVCPPPAHLLARAPVARSGDTDPTARNRSSTPLTLATRLPDYVSRIDEPTGVEPEEEASGSEPEYSAAPAATPAAPAKPAKQKIVALLVYSFDLSKSLQLPPDKFGLTASTFSISNQQFSDFAGAYSITGQLDHSIFWNVRSGTGPGGQVSIDSEDDPKINADNYRQIARDLTPDDTGRPPRREYWSEHLTMVHEMFHVDRHMTYYKEEMLAAMDWLNRKMATSLAHARKLFERALYRLDSAVSLKINLPKEEDDAYEAGAEEYRQLAEGIMKRGKEGRYPSP